MQLSLDLKNADRSGSDFRPAGDPRTNPLIQTQVHCRGNVQMEAVFSSWENAAQVGLVLNSDYGTGYTFLLHVGPPPTASPEFQSIPAEVSENKDQPLSVSSFTQARKSGRQFMMQILRNGIPLRQRLLSPAEVAGGPLLLSVKRAGERLTFQLNAAKPLEFQDMFPLGGSDSGVFGLNWPEGVQVTVPAGLVSDLTGRSQSPGAGR